MILETITDKKGGAQMAMRYSKQREAIWNFIKDRKDHPSADTVFHNVRKSFPNISLGTVYRNLILLKETGQLRIVDVGDGVAHFDPNISEHLHFICKECRQIIDIDDENIEHLKMRASRNFSGKIMSYSGFFYGLCEECLNQQPKAVNN